LYEVKVGQSFVGFTYQENPLVISIIFSGFFKIGGYLFTQKNLRKEGCFYEEKSMVDFIII